MLFEDRRVAPAARAVELRHHGRLVFDTHLVDPVFVAVQRQHARIADEAGTFHGIEHKVRRKCVEGMAHGRLREWAGQCIAPGRLNNRVQRTGGRLAA